MIINPQNLKMAIGDTTHTLVGVGIGPSTKFPISWGNCFSVMCDHQIQYRIVNFNYENLQYLLVHKMIQFPIQILVLAGTVAVFHDFRIEYDWYSDRFCETCCPEDLLPIPQQLKIQRDKDAGIIVDKEITMGDGRKMIIRSQKINPTL
jgi:hypothetical protein